MDVSISLEEHSDWWRPGQAAGRLSGSRHILYFCPWPWAAASVTAVGRTVLTNGTSDCDLTWKLSLQIKLRLSIEISSYSIWVDPKSSENNILIRDRKRHRHTHTGHVKRRQRLELSCYWQSGAWSHEARRAGRTLRAFRGSTHGPAGSWILDFSPTELWVNKFLLLEATQLVLICHGHSRKLQIPDWLWHLSFHHDIGWQHDCQSGSFCGSWAEWFVKTR